MRGTNGAHTVEIYPLCACIAKDVEHVSEVGETPDSSNTSATDCSLKPVSVQGGADAIHMAVGENRSQKYSYREAGGDGFDNTILCLTANWYQ